MKKSNYVSLAVTGILLICWLTAILLFIGVVKDDSGNLPRNYIFGLAAGFVPFIAGILFSILYRPVYNNSSTENSMVPYFIMGSYLLITTILNTVFTFIPGNSLYIAIVLVNLFLLVIFAAASFAYVEHRNKLLNLLAADAERKYR